MQTAPGSLSAQERPRCLVASCSVLGTFLSTSVLPLASQTMHRVLEVSS